VAGTMLRETKQHKVERWQSYSWQAHTPVEPRAHCMQQCLIIAGPGSWKAMHEKCNSG
jgi:hypothetical protein